MERSGSRIGVLCQPLHPAKSLMTSRMPSATSALEETFFPIHDISYGPVSFQNKRDQETLTRTQQQTHMRRALGVSLDTIA